MNNKEKYEQFFTPDSIAKCMSSYFSFSQENIRFLDPGAGTGNLSIALLNELSTRKIKPIRINGVLYEIDKLLISDLNTRLLKQKEKLFNEFGIYFDFEIRNKDFILDSINLIGEREKSSYNIIIMNPPYGKINSKTVIARKLKKNNISSVNLYTTFIELSGKLLDKEGEMVAITPRSFCNGAYFENFRKELLSRVRLKNIHLFDSRTSPFQEENVLQETMITHSISLEPDNNNSYEVNISHSSDGEFSSFTEKKFDVSEIIHLDDDLKTIRIPKHEGDILISNLMKSLPCTLMDLGVAVSTGPIVNFRQDPDVLNYEMTDLANQYLASGHISNYHIIWPQKNVKYNSIIKTEQNLALLRPKGNYVLIKRMTSKEEKKRVHTAVLLKENISTDYCGLNNKLNYIHSKKHGISKALAIGISMYLNSSFVDSYFRIISGHTQVNVTDLNAFKYPDKKTLMKLGRKIMYKQEEIDKKIEKIISKK